MATMWRKAMLYLGLGPDDEYEDDVRDDGRPAPREQAAVRAQPSARPQPSPGRPQPAPRPRPAPVEGGSPGASVRSLPTGGDPSAPKVKPAVRQVPAAAKPYVLSPTNFNHAQELADRFRANQPVILNLQGVDRELARRLIDFSSGLCYGVSGHMEKVAQNVYLLTPTNVEVSAEERRRLHERGLHDA